MEWLHSISAWLTGGDHPYHKLYQCMMGDTLWITITVTLDLMVAIGYIVIALHWIKNQRLLPPSPARTALGAIRNIFIFCGLCGYIFIPVKMFWPAWRLYDMFLAVLVFYTWRYALGAKDLRVVYTAIGRSNQLAEDLARSREESKKKSFFLNAVSHDLRTPLNSLILSAHLAEMQAGAGDIAGVKAALETIKNNGRQTAELLDGLLEYARLEGADQSVQHTQVELDDLLRDVLNAHAAMAADKSLELTGDTNTGIILRSDRLKLERIMNNLVANAIKFTASGSVRVDATQRNGSTEISVTDTGIGIGPEDQQHLFQEFFQAGNHARVRQKGFGLGLAISRRLAWQLGGEIHVDSQPGAEAGLSWQLLMQNPPSRRLLHPEGQHSSPHRSASKPLVLIVEDDSDTASAMMSILRYNDIEVLWAATVSEAVSMLSRHPGVVVLDLMLPDGSGVDVLRHIRAASLPVRVLVTTACVDAEHLAEVEQLRVDQMLKKPIDVTELLKAIDSGE